MSNLQTALADACHRAGVIARDVPPDGRFHSADIKGDRSGRGDARIKLFADGEGGLVSNWKSGETIPFFINESHVCSDTERAELAEHARVEQAKAHADAARRASEILQQCTPCDGHHYLTKKGVQSAQGLRILASADDWGRMGCLVIPARDATGVLCTLQFIDANGDKRFLKDGKKSGCYCSIGTTPGEGQPLAICEGLGTGLSVHQATGWPVAIAFDAGNLSNVATAIRVKYPNAKLIIAADNDVSGTGQNKATEAAQAVGAWIALPPSAPGASADWNDVHASQGLDVVRELLALALDSPSAENSWGNWGTGADAPKACNHGEKPAPVNSEDSPQSAPQLGQKAGFRVIKATKGHKDGVHFIGDDPDKPPLWICGPLEIEADTRDATGNNWC